MPNQLESTLRSIVACLGRKTPEPLLQWNETEASFTIQVSARDQGRFIGKGGIVIWALKSVFWYAGLAQIKRTVDINLLEPKDPSADQRAAPFKPDPKWDRTKVSDMINQVLNCCFKDSLMGWDISEPEPAKPKVTIHLQKYLQMPCSDPDFAEAIKTLIHAAGMANGCTIKTEVSWT